MIKKFKTIALLSAVCLLSTSIYSISYAGANFNYQPATVQQNADSLKGNVVFVPAGTTVNVALSRELNSESISEGTMISTVLTEDFTYNNQVLAPAGSTLQGTVTKAKKAGFGNRNGQIQVVFNNIATPYGQNIPVNGVFQTEDGTGILKGGTKTDAAKNYVKDSVVGAGAGAVLGTAMGAMSGGSVGRGAIYGTALGGGLGIAKGISEKGNNVYIPANAALNVLFTQPVTVNSSQGYDSFNW